MACGLVALMVSRGSSMLMEGIEELKTLTGKWENAICLVSGVVAGVMLGLGGVMWSESVAINRISLFGVPWVMLVMLCLFRWIYAPSQRRYLYIALFFFGICATIHQTLLVAAMGLEIAMGYVQPKLGRNLAMFNGILYIFFMIAQGTGLVTMLNTSGMVLFIFQSVGIGSVIAYFWLAVKTKETFNEFCRDGVLAVTLWVVAGFPVIGVAGTVFFGFCAFLVFLALAWKTRHLGLEWLVVVGLGLLWVAGASFYFYEPIAGMTNPPMQWGYPRTVDGFFHALSRGQYEKATPSPIFEDPFHFLLQIGMLIADIVHEYNWVCIFVALVPLLFFLKMQKRERAWIIALFAVYLCIGGLLLILMNPQPDRQSADLSRVFFASSHALIAIMMGYGFALAASYIATHYQRMRTAGLMIGIVLLVPALTAFYNGISDTFYGGLGFVPYNRVLLFFVLVSLALTLTALAAQRLLRMSEAPAGTVAEDNNRKVLYGLGAGAVVALLISLGIVYLRSESLSLPQLMAGLAKLFAPYQYSNPAIAGSLILIIVAGFIGSLAAYRKRAPLAISLGLFALLPLTSGLWHWAGAEQRNHWFGFWFGHDMFTPPVVGPDGRMTYDAKVRADLLKGTNAALVYPEMAKDTILYGGTDPGRFNPTYAIFCDSFIPDSCKPEADPTFDRRDVYLITQNALADGTYLNYLRAQYFRSQQQDPPFFSELARTVLKDSPYKTNFLAKVVTPLDSYFTARGARVERRWRTSTSMFTDKEFANLSALVARLKPGGSQDPVSKWLFDNISKETQDTLTGSAEENRVRGALARDLNVLIQRELNQKALLDEKKREKDEIDDKVLSGSGSERLRRNQEELAKEIGTIKVEPLYDSNRFGQVKISDYLQKFIAQNPQSDTRIRLNRLLLEAAYPSEIAKSLGGVYPDREIYIPSPNDLTQCFSEYTSDAARRLQHDNQFPSEPKQLHQGEGVAFTPDGRVQVYGQVSVMNINGLLTKVIFDHNPDNEFYIEESFPLEWMFPHLTPYGIIMKINRNALPELTDEICRRDHEFWSKYSERTIGNWITYDTSVKEIAEFVQRVYLGRNLKGFTGDPRFVRDDQSQKAFSKLRSSIAGIYSWRLGMAPSGAAVPRQYLPKTPEESARILREADFAFKQAFAFCPYSPEAVYRYVTLLANTGRLPDALVVAETCLKLDPYNGQVRNLVNGLRGARQ
jgi:hypothetical protein